jgi:hypothetical protein
MTKLFSHICDRVPTSGSFRNEKKKEKNQLHAELYENNTNNFGKCVLFYISFNFIAPSCIRNAADLKPEYKALIFLLPSLLHSQSKKIDAAKNTTSRKLIGTEMCDVINV